MITSNNTSITNRDGATVVTLHRTDIVRIDGNVIRLDSGGWQTVTTKRRMNEVAREYGLPFSVYQKNHDWFVDYAGETIEFHDGMILS